MLRPCIIAFLFHGLILIIPLTAHGQLSSPSASPSSGSVESAPTFDPAAATRAWLATVPADERAKSDAYFEGGYWLLLWNFLLAAAISFLLLGSHISARLRDFVERRTSFKNAQVVLYALPYLVIAWVLSFPLNVYQYFWREHQYGMATQNFSQWFGEQLIALAVGLAFGTVVLLVLYGVFRRAPRTWWVWGAIVAMLFSMIGLLLAPVYVEPLFNTYKPIDGPAVKEPILAMARANQIPVTQVFAVDASRQTKRISANVAGFLGTTRIALNDNLLNQCTLPEIREVMAHEMGHYILNHVAKLLAYLVITLFVVFALTRIIFDAAVRRWGERWGVRGIADPAGMPLLALILSAFVFLLTPFSNTVVHVTEREADAFSINTAREPDSMASVALKLGAYRKLDPGPLEEFIFFDHPSGRARIRMAMDWKAAHLPAGETPR
ncbi:MAG: M48 family metallopeptidase [Chthoniobacterales bacterium]